jgi:hypothetical protein
LLDDEEPPHAARPRANAETAAATAIERFGIVTFCIGDIEKIEYMRFGKIA